MIAASSIALTFVVMSRMAAAQNAGYATYSNGNGGVCSGVASSLPSVSMNAAQFGGGEACGQCVQIQGTGNGAGKDPVSTAPYIAVINNVCPQCAPGDIDLQESGDGKFGITWSFTACPGSGRKLIEGGRKLIIDEQRTTEIRVSETVSAVVEEIPNRQEDHYQDQRQSESAAATNENSQLDNSQQTSQPVSSPSGQPTGQSTEASSQSIEEQEEQQPEPSGPAASFAKEGPVSRKILL